LKIQYLKKSDFEKESMIDLINYCIEKIVNNQGEEYSKHDPRFEAANIKALMDWIKHVIVQCGGEADVVEMATGKTNYSFDNYWKKIQYCQDILNAKTLNKILPTQSEWANESAGKRGPFYRPYEESKSFICLRTLATTATTSKASKKKKSITKFSVKEIIYEIQAFYRALSLKTMEGIVDGMNETSKKQLCSEYATLFKNIQSLLEGPTSDNVTDFSHMELGDCIHQGIEGKTIYMKKNDQDRCFVFL
jgi:hypothetical protein